MTKLTGAALDRAVAHAMGLKSVHNCEKWSGAMDETQPAQEQPVHMEMPEPEGWYCYDHDYPYEGHKYHTVEQIQKIVTAAVEAERKALAQPAQEADILTIAYQSGYYDGKKAALAGREWNFCERCGKRTKDMTTIHTCTPPQGDA
jgi:hypothetical protein